MTVVKLAPMGDPMELQIHGYELTLRLADADQIEVEPIKKPGPENMKDQKVSAIRSTRDWEKAVNIT